MLAIILAEHSEVNAFVWGTCIIISFNALYYETASMETYSSYNEWSINACNLIMSPSYGCMII
jgi:hypothetical protein